MKKKNRSADMYVTAAMAMAMAAGCGSKAVLIFRRRQTRKQATRLVFSSLQSTDLWITAGKVSWKDWKRKASRKEII